MFKFNFCAFFLINVLACNSAEPTSHKVVEKPKPVQTVKTIKVSKIVAKDETPMKIQKRIVPAKPRSIVIGKAKESFKKFRRRVKNKSIITIIDYDISRRQDRLWVIDMKTNKILLQSKVSHAGNSGNLYADIFSNKPNSNTSSKGSFVTVKKPFDGKYGYSLRVKGLEKGVNHNALRRGIIFHPNNGSTWSYGCFMTDNGFNDELIDTIVGGTFVYVHKGERNI